MKLICWISCSTSGDPSGLDISKSIEVLWVSVGDSASRASSRMFLRASALILSGEAFLPLEGGVCRPLNYFSLGEYIEKGICLIFYPGEYILKEICFVSSSCSVFWGEYMLNLISLTKLSLLGEQVCFKGDCWGEKAWKLICLVFVSSFLGRLNF